MFNSPILDICIGIVFIFLLYSLLATSIAEAFASLFALRARMLRKGIIKGMLSNTRHTYFGVLEEAHREIRDVRSKYRKDRETHKTNTWTSPKNAVVNFIHALQRLVTGMPYEYKKDTLGGDFYLHPIIRNFGSSRRYAVPSYITKANFSTVLLDTLEKYFSSHIEGIKQRYPEADIDESMPRITKINFLIAYLADPGQMAPTEEKPRIDSETLEILQLYLKESYQNAEVFTKKIEDWFNATMDRVSGWYKRQGQGILAVIGFVLAFTFNVDVIEITQKLSNDKVLAAKLADISVQAAERFKDDPRVQKHAGGLIQSPKTEEELQRNKENTDTIAKLKSEYDRHIDSATVLLKKDIKDVNGLMAIGWGDYGFKKDSLHYLRIYARCHKKYEKEIGAADRVQYYKTCDSLLALSKNNSHKPHVMDSLFNDLEKRRMERQQSLDTRAFYRLYDSKKTWIKLGYMFSHTGPRKWTSYAIFTLGICLGAPFWFDMLQKVVKLRASGKKEDTGNAAGGTDTGSTQVPVQVTVTNNQNTAEAVG